MTPPRVYSHRCQSIVHRLLHFRSTITIIYPTEMKGKYKGSYHSTHRKNAKVLKSTAVRKRGQRHEPAAPPHLCGKCGFQGLDAYDITLHLHSNRHCFIITNDPITLPLPHLSPELSPHHQRRVIPTCTRTSYDGFSSKDMKSCSSPLGIRKTSRNSC
jgi:hypothetical protein